MVTETLTHEGNELHMGTELLEVETPTAVPPVDTAGVRTKSLKDCGVLGPMKYIRLGQDQDDWFPSIGGEAREVLEQIGNDNWGANSRFGTPISTRGACSISTSVMASTSARLSG